MAIEPRHSISSARLYTSELHQSVIDVRSPVSCMYLPSRLQSLSQKKQLRVNLDKLFEGSARCHLPLSQSRPAILEGIVPL